MTTRQTILDRAERFERVSPHDFLPGPVAIEQIKRLFSELEDEGKLLRRSMRLWWT
jgi:hypothetical protein